MDQTCAWNCKPLDTKAMRVLPTLAKITYGLRLKAYEKVIDDHHTEDVDND